MLGALDDQQVDYLLIGGMSFLIRHRPELTFDVDIWVLDQPENLARLNRALRRLGVAWGATEEEWKPVPESEEWLRRQSVYCLTTEHGALDVFREVRRLEGACVDCRERGVRTETAAGVLFRVGLFRGLSDEDMLTCQEALPLAERKLARMRVLLQALQGEQRQGHYMPEPTIKQAEERKRDAAYDPRQRWRHIQETITWAEANLPSERCRNRPRRPTSAEFPRDDSHTIAEAMLATRLEVEAGNGASPKKRALSGGRCHDKT